MSQEARTILYADDDPDDREFLSWAIRTISPATEVVLVEDGLKAINYLDVAGAQRLPCLIVLDLNMPFLDGRETYERIRKRPELSGVPTVVFTSSHNPNDKILFNSFGVELISKPDDLKYFDAIASQMLQKCYC